MDPGCGLPAEGSQRPAACPAVPAQYCPADHGPAAPRRRSRTPKIKPVGFLTSAPALWLSPFTGQHLPEAEATERAATLLCWPSRATAGPVACPSAGAAPGSRAPASEQGWVCTGLPGPNSSMAYRQGQMFLNVLSPRVCPHLSVCLCWGCPQVSESRARRASL